MLLEYRALALPRCAAWLLVGVTEDRSCRADLETFGTRLFGDLVVDKKQPATSFDPDTPVSILAAVRPGTTVCLRKEYVPVRVID